MGLKLSAPKFIVWLIALLLGILGVVGHLVIIPVVTGIVAFWLVVVGLGLLVIATAVKGL